MTSTSSAMSRKSDIPSLGGTGVQSLERALLFPNPCRDTLTEIVVNLAPIVEGPRENWFGNPILEVPDYIAHKACACCVIEYATHHGARLAEVIVLGAQGVRLAHHIAVGVPEPRFVGALRVGLGARLKHRGPRVAADVMGDLEMTEGAAALRVWLTLRDAFAIEVRHLLDQVMIVQNDGAIRTDGE